MGLEEHGLHILEGHLLAVAGQRAKDMVEVPSRQLEVLLQQFLHLSACLDGILVVDFLLWAALLWLTTEELI